jgi:hypothetical protein
MLTVAQVVVSLHLGYLGLLIDKEIMVCRMKNKLFHPGSDPIAARYSPAGRELGTAPPK